MFVEYDEYYEEKHENGVVKVTGQYKNGVKEGAWVEYDDKGYLILPIKLFINGKEQ
jgi:antitoxin component YwqK of YwqJK toxin-antitoxin module